MPKTVVQVPIELLFDERQRSEALAKLGEADVVIITGDEIVLLNMSEVLFTETYENVVVVHFKNGGTLSITRSPKRKTGK